MPAPRIGTSAFTAAGWEGAFYPAGMPKRGYLTYYATRFDTVEVDSTFYAAPSVSTVKAWHERTPPGFTFCLKVPQIITHEKVLVDSDAELKEFLDAASALHEKLGPIVFQFGYFNRSAFKSQAEFLARLKPFLAKLPSGFEFVVEIRNKEWIDARYADILRASGVAMALTDRSSVPRPWEFEGRWDILTANFAYVRLLGDRKGIEQLTQVWNREVTDRTTDLRSWVDYLKPIQSRGTTIYVYVNNHYSGCGFVTARKLLEMFGVEPLSGVEAPREAQGRLF
jgi:uncharacterized protein YecE (DUF72 family)